MNCIPASYPPRINSRWSMEQAASMEHLEQERTTTKILPNPLPQDLNWDGDMSIRLALFNLAYWSAFALLAGLFFLFFFLRHRFKSCLYSYRHRTFRFWRNSRSAFFFFLWATSEGVNVVLEKARVTVPCSVEIPIRAQSLPRGYFVVYFDKISPDLLQGSVVLADTNNNAFARLDLKTPRPLSGSSPFISGGKK
jgi:hypothetical protein